MWNWLRSTNAHLIVTRQGQSAKIQNFVFDCMFFLPSSSYQILTTWTLDCFIYAKIECFNLSNPYLTFLSPVSKLWSSKLSLIVSYSSLSSDSISSLGNISIIQGIFPHRHIHVLVSSHKKTMSWQISSIKLHTNT